MNYTDEGLRGGGGCCKNKKKTFTINSVNDGESFNCEKSFPDFSSLNNDFEELEDFESTKDEEETGWNDTYTQLLTDKYESTNRNCLEDDDDGEADFLDQYLLSMSPIIDEKTKEQGEKGKKGTTSRTVPRRPHDVSVKCSDSTEEIVGSPSEVALRLNDAIQHYLPRRKIKIEEEVSKEAAVAMNEEFEKDPDEESIENLCLEKEPQFIPKPRGCPGTYDRLRKKNVPCADALTLREIALGRRIKRPDFMLPVEDQYGMIQSTQPNSKGASIGGKENCCCAKKRDAKKHSPPPSKPCCTKQPRNNKNVSFSF